MIMRLQLQFYCPGDLVFRKGDAAKEMYIVRSGLLQVVSDDGMEVYASLSQGSVFGEVSLLSSFSRGEQKRNSTVRSQSYCELFTLSNLDFHEVLENYPLAKQAVLTRSRPVHADDNEPIPSPPTAQTILEDRLKKLGERAPMLSEDINGALLRMISETNELKKRLAGLEHLCRIRDL